MSTDVVTEAPLASYRIVGIRENWFQAASDAPRQPGGSCWHCGTGIANEVVIRNVGTGETHTIGTTCAERVGLDKAELKRLLADKYAEERHQRSLAGREAWRIAAEAREVVETEARGPHGTESRYLSGCFCDLCLSVAPHRTLHRFFNGACRCLECIAFVMAELPKEFFVREQVVIVDVETGEVVPAKMVSTQYGGSWCVNDGDAWLPIGAKRRTTLTNKGYTETTVPMLTQRCGHGREQWYKPICRMGAPIADRWGEPIHRRTA